jgi:hypothetical protein
MYAEPFVSDVDNTVASTLHTNTYNLISFPSGQASIRKNAATDDGSKVEVMRISHQVVGSGSSARDRHLVRFEVSSNDLNDDVGTTAPAVAYAVFDIPRVNLAEGAPETLARQLCGFLRGANADDEAPDYATNFAKLMNGEM